MYFRYMIDVIELDRWCVVYHLDSWILWI